MPFKPFQDTFNPFGKRTSVADIPWYKLGGAPDPIFAYSSDAASYAASKVNLINPGTYDLTVPNLDPTWATSGWTMAASGGGSYFDTGYTPPAGNYTILLGVVTAPVSTYFFGAWPNNSTGLLVFRNPAGATLRHYQPASGNSSDYANAIANTSMLIVSKNVAYLSGNPLTAVGAVGDLGANSASMYFGACNRFDGVYAGNGKYNRLAMYSGILTPTQMAALTNP